MLFVFMHMSAYLRILHTSLLECFGALDTAEDNMYSYVMLRLGIISKFDVTLNSFTFCEMDHEILLLFCMNILYKYWYPAQAMKEKKPDKH